MENASMKVLKDAGTNTSTAMKENHMEEMAVITVTEEDLIGKRTLRDKYIDRLDILEKVKALFLIPEVNLMSTGMVAKFFEVPVETIKKTYQRNKDEIDSDGAKLLKAKDLFNRDTMSPLKFQPVQGGAIVTCDDGSKFQLPNREAVYYTPRSIMRIAMLLQGSDVAKEVRTRLLNAVEQGQDKKEVSSEIGADEKHLKDQLWQMIMDEDVGNRILGARSIVQHFQKQIMMLESEKQELVRENADVKTALEILTEGAQRWGNRKVLNALMRAIGAAYSRNEAYYSWNYRGNAAKMWKELYRRLQYSDSICLKRRNSDKPIDAIREDEWPVVFRQAAALAEDKGVDIVEVIGELNKAEKIS